MRNGQNTGRPPGAASRIGWAALLLALALVGASAAGAQWASSPGAKVRDAFGPVTARGVSVCRGACGAGCPSSCDESEIYECLDGEKLRRVRRYVCGTHAGCRAHDDCLDRCAQQHAQGFDCQGQCHSEAVERYGFENATAWATGGGPTDGPPITFDYTVDAPGDPAPAFRCPEGSSRSCSPAGGVCRTASGAVAPVFDSYPGASGMKISSFRSGALCGGKVCSQASDIQVTGKDSCEGVGNCTRFGVEFDYVNANPAAPLECSTALEGGDDGDFIGGIIKRGFDKAPQMDGKTFEGNEGLGQLLGMFQKVVQSADSPEDVKISMAPLGPDGKPIESQRVGSGDPSAPPEVPRSVPVPAARGHLVIPMYESAPAAPIGRTTVKQVRCSHQGQPVFETTFRIHE